MNPPLLEWLTLFGTLFFAASGARLGVRKGFDLLGVLVLGCVAAVGGGTLRDVLTGQTPPLWFRNERLLWAAILGSLLAFLFYRRFERLASRLDILDSAGLALFAALAAQRATVLQYGPLGVVFIGTISGVGGGVIRDLLAREVPLIFLPGELYASTAALGSLAVYLAHNRLSPEMGLALGIMTTLVTRLIARRFGLTLPVRDPERPLLGKDKEPKP